MALPINYSDSLTPLYPELKLESGTIYMEFLVDSGATLPRRFIFDESLLDNEKVRALNIKTLIKLLEEIFELDLESVIDYKSPDFNKLSFICLEAAEYMKSREVQIREELLDNLEQVCFVEQGEVCNEPEALPVAPSDTQETPQEYFAEESKLNNYETWEHKELINYILMLEVNNAELTDRVNVFQKRIDGLNNELDMYKEMERRENFVPDVIRAGKDEKKRWFIF